MQALVTVYHEAVVMVQLPCPSPPKKTEGLEGNMAMQWGQNTKNLQADKKTKIVHISLLLDSFCSATLKYTHSATAGAPAPETQLL